MLTTLAEDAMTKETWADLWRQEKNHFVIALPAPASAPVAVASAATGGAWGVQIGAFTSTSIADQEFAQVIGANPSFASGRSKVIQPVPGKNLYRTIVAGFSREQAVAFCTQLKTQGRDCLIKGAA